MIWYIEFPIQDSSQLPCERGECIDLRRVRAHTLYRATNSQAFHAVHLLCSRWYAAVLTHEQHLALLFHMHTPCTCTQQIVCDYMRRVRGAVPYAIYICSAHRRQASNVCSVRTEICAAIHRAHTLDGIICTYEYIRQCMMCTHLYACTRS